MRAITKGISVIFHPIFIPMLAFFLYLQIDHFSLATLKGLPTNAFWIVFSAIALFSFLMPLVGLNFLINAGMVENWEIKNHKERVPALILTSIFLGCLYYIFHYFEAMNGFIFHAFFGVIMSGIVLSLLGAVISNFWKISLHCIGISGLAGAIIGLSTSLSPLRNYTDMVMINSGVLLAAGIVGFARLYQNAHNLSQVIAGMLLGFGVAFLIVNKGWYF